MKLKQNGLLANGLIWFGAATSLAEIEAGLHCRGNLTAVLSGHLLGFFLLFATGAIGGHKRQSAMETTVEAFGTAGSRFFAGLNVLQLIGWTAVMISLGATAAVTLLPQIGFVPFCGIVGGAAILALLVDFRHSTFLSAGTIALLAILAAYLTFAVTRLPTVPELTVSDSFAKTFELSVAMPLSWLPLISDHTKDAERPLAAAAVSALSYSVVSVWMYVLGTMIAAVRTDGNIAAVILRTGIGFAGLAIVILSTSISAFLDLYSSGESSRTLWKRIPAKAVGLLTGLVGIIFAISGIEARYASFLYLIASVFAPMASVLLVEHYFVRRRHTPLNLCAWVAGTVLYHLSATSPLGPTLTAILIAGAIASLGKFFVCPAEGRLKSLRLSRIAEKT